LLYLSRVSGWCDGLDTKYRTLTEHSPLHNAAASSAARQGSRGSRGDKAVITTPELIHREGYPSETHYVTTEDGYVLTLHRIPHGKTNVDDGGPRPVVVLAHGLLCSSFDFVVQNHEKGLGFLLAEDGYDVWMVNFRGNYYSRNHTSLDPWSPIGAFWKFTWDEMAKYDLPATFDKVLEVTDEGDLMFVGHGMGATAFLAMNHYRKDLTTKVRLANLMGPTVYVENMISPIAYLAKQNHLWEIIFDLIGNGEFLPGGIWYDCMASLFCSEVVFQGVCENALFLMVGFDNKQMNDSLFSTIMLHTPAGTSSYTILQFAQEVISGGFHGYDWGRHNDDHHGDDSPPTYDISDIDTPTAIYWGDNDWLADPEDMKKLLNELPSIVPGMVHEIAYEGWNHLDFLWGIDAPTYVYRDLMRNLEYCEHADCWALIDD